MTSTAPTGTMNLPVKRPQGWARFRGRLLGLPTLQVIVLLALVLWLVISVPGITSPVSIISILMLASLLAFAALGQTLVVILGGLDLAIPGYIIVGAFVASNLAGGADWPPWLAVLTTLCVCGLFGAFVGFVSYRYSIQPLVLTLGVSAALTGGTLFLAGSDLSWSPPESMRRLTGITSTTFGLPVPPLIIIFILFSLLVWLFFSLIS